MNLSYKTFISCFEQIAKHYYSNIDSYFKHKIENGRPVKSELYEPKGNFGLLCTFKHFFNKEGKLLYSEKIKDDDNYKLFYIFNIRGEIIRFIEEWGSNETSAVVRLSYKNGLISTLKLEGIGCRHEGDYKLDFKYNEFNKIVQHYKEYIGDSFGYTEPPTYIKYNYVDNNYLLIEKTSSCSELNSLIHINYDNKNRIIKYLDEGYIYESSKMEIYIYSDDNLTIEHYENSKLVNKSCIKKTNN